jgi:hypothetical protein
LGAKEAAMTKVVETRIHVLEHKKTGLLMALSDDLPGFIVLASLLEAA